MRGKWPSFDRLPQPGESGAATGIWEDGDAYSNPFQPIEKLGPSWAEAGMDSETIVAAAVALGGLPRGRNADTNLQYYAEEIHRLHGTEPGGEQ
jgi:hypothetical protein